MSNEGTVRIRSWQEFKQEVIKKKPGSIVYVMEQNGLSPNKEITVLRLIMLHNKRYYIFIDTPKDDELRETRIPLRKDKNGARFLEEEDILSYLKKEFQGEQLEFYYFWTA